MLPAAATGRSRVGGRPGEASTVRAGRANPFAAPQEPRRAISPTRVGGGPGGNGGKALALTRRQPIPRNAPPGARDPSTSAVPPGESPQERLGYSSHEDEFASPGPGPPN